MCESNLTGLEKMVDSLVSINQIGIVGNYMRVKQLQKISEMLLNEYVIKIGNMTIEPLLIEAYYYHKGKFEDTSVHAAKDSTAPTYELARKRQKNNFGKLYVHYGTKDGIDIVLSLGDYYLSFLIKNALVDGEWTTQCGVSKKLCEEKCDRFCECKGLECKYYDEIVLESIEPKNQEIVFFPRKGIKNDFAEEKLAALPINKIKEHRFTTGISCTEILAEYIVEKYVLNNHYAKSIEEKEAEEKRLKELAKGFITWEKIFEI